MNFLFSIYSLIEFFAVFITVSTILILWNHIKSQDVKWLIYLEICILIWSLSYAFELGAILLKDKILWAKVSYFGIVFVPVAYYIFTLYFTQNILKISSKRLILLSIIPVITLILLLTNDFHRLIWEKTTLLQNKLNIVEYKHGYWFWVFWVFSQTFIFAGIFNLIKSINLYKPVFKKQNIILIFATLLPLTGNILYVFDLNLLQGFDSTTLSFALTGFIIALGINNFHMFKLSPVTRNRHIDTMEDGVIVVNSMGLIEDFNSSACKIFTLDCTSILKRSFYDLFSKYERLTDTLKFNTHKIVYIDINRDKSINHYQVQVSPVFNKAGKNSGHFFLVRNITTMKKVENELIKTNKKLLREIENREKLIDDLDSFAHTVAHDLKNSIGAIINSSEILKENIVERNFDFLAEMADLIKESASKTMHVMNELLILGTVSHQELEKKTIDMAAVFKEAVKQLQIMILERNVQIKIPEKWPDVLGNETWIEEVWLNYLSNAIKYGGDPPRIEVGSQILDNGMVKFWIKDNGKGLTIEDQEKLYKKNTRLDPHRAEGYGFGLSIIKRIVTKLGGEVGVESNISQKTGTTFYFTLKAAD